MTGQTISHYRILEKLGEGGMGVVWKAEDTRLRRTVALKLLPSYAVQDPEFHERFVREAQAAAALQHSNIATVFELDEEHGFFAMELVEGPSLREKIKERPLKLNEALRIATEVADGLQAAHEKGIVHRDIKSGNILLTPEGKAKITDFGLAALVDRTRVTKTGAALGTPGYMAPEQARGEKVDRRADIWALGVVLYEMLAGRLPFRGDSEAAVVHSILHEEPEPVTALRAGLPPQLDSVLAKTLAKNPDDRYHHVDDLLVDLRHLSASAPLAVAPRRLAFSRRAMLGLVGTLVAILVVLVGLNVGGLRERLFGRIGTPPIESLAVLPLENLSGDPSQEFFTHGMTEALIAELSKIKALKKVISRTSVMQYEGTKKPIPQIAKELGVDALIEGSALKEGDTVRITVQLIHGATDAHLWANSFDREYKNILALHSDVARAIAQEH
jgi:TolB-like protein